MDFNPEPLIREIQDAKYLSIDTEFYGPSIPGGSKRNKDRINTHAANIAGMSICLPRWKEGLYLPIDHASGDLVPGRAVVDVLMAIKREGIPVWFWNAKADLRVLGRFLQRFGVTTRPEVLFPRVADAQGAAYLLDRRATGKKPFALKPHAKMTLGVDRPDWWETSNGRQANQLTVEEISAYAAADARDTLHLGERYLKELEASGQAGVFWNLEMPFLRVIQHMEDSGVHVDCDHLTQLAVELTGKVATLKEEWEFMFPTVDIGSSQQVSKHFFGYEGPEIWSPKDVKTGKKGLYSCDSDSMELQLTRLEPGTLGHRAAELRLEYNDLTKNLSTYTTSLVGKVLCHPDKRLHPQFNQYVTRTYRLSSSDPNFQNIPVRSALGKSVRRAFSTGPGQSLVKGDYSQIELRVLAHLAGRGKLSQAFVEGRDVHQATADAMGISRNIGKILNFLVVYGGREAKIQKVTGCSQAEAQRHYRSFWRELPEISALKAKVLDGARELGYVATLLGHRRFTPLLRRVGQGERFPRSMHSELWKEERIAFNTPIQGGAADIIKQASINLYDELVSQKLLGPVKICGQVHDENVLQSPSEIANEVADILRRTMEEAVVLRVPLVADVKIVQNWAEGK